MTANGPNDQDSAAACYRIGPRLLQVPLREIVIRPGPPRSRLPA